MYRRRNKKEKNSGKHRLEAVIEGKEVVDRIVTAVCCNRWRRAVRGEEWGA